MLNVNNHVLNTKLLIVSR